MADNTSNAPGEPAYNRPRHERAARQPRAVETYASEDAPRESFPATIRRISWGAILAGAAVALVLQLLFNLFGLAAGLGAVDPATEQESLSGLGIGTGLWLVVSSLIALFAGGWAAGHFAGLPGRIDGLLHGFVTWAVTTFATVYLIASGVGFLIGGAFGLVQQGTEVLAQGAQIVAPEVTQQIGGELSAEQIQQEALTILRQTGQEELQPENLAARAQQATDAAGQAAAEAAQSPEEAESAIRQALTRLIAIGEETVSEVDREAVVNVLVARTDMSRAEARETVQQYEAAFAEAQQELQQTGQQLGQEATQAADRTAGIISSAALWSALALVVGAIAAAGGGAAGAPRDLPASPAVRRE